MKDSSFYPDVKPLYWLIPISYVVIGVIALALEANGQDIREHHEHQSVAGQFYASWLMPNLGRPRQASCCNQLDCYATAFKRENHIWFARRREDGKWIVVPETKLEHMQTDPRESPDGQSHVCAAPPHRGDVVYCAVLGSQG